MGQLTKLVDRYVLFARVAPVFTPWAATVPREPRKWAAYLGQRFPASSTQNRQSAVGDDGRNLFF